MKTNLELFSELPSPIKEAAVRNAGESFLARKGKTTCLDALWHAFVWEDTPEGHDFWESVCGAIEKNAPFPALPVIAES